MELTTILVAMLATVVAMAALGIAYARHKIALAYKAEVAVEKVALTATSEMLAMIAKNRQDLADAQSALAASLAKWDEYQKTVAAMRA